MLNFLAAGGGAAITVFGIKGSKDANLPITKVRRRGGGRQGAGLALFCAALRACRSAPLAFFPHPPPLTAAAAHRPPRPPLNPPQGPQTSGENGKGGSVRSRL
jgi:hypothetical protein